MMEQKSIAENETERLKKERFIVQISDYVKLGFASEKDGFDLISKIKNTKENIDFQEIDQKVLGLLESRFNALENLKKDPDISEENLNKIVSLHEKLQDLLEEKRRIIKERIN
jgi:hypothetical protein